MLEHQQCPRCHAPNLSSEVICFACGAGLRPRPKRLWRSPPTQAPLLLWAALLAGLAAAALVGWQVAVWLAGYRFRSTLPSWALPGAGGLLIAAGQIAFAGARRRDRRWWVLKRAPELPMSQAHVGDSVWLRGELGCDSPLIAPYTTQECAYYRYLLRERDPGEAGWRTTEYESKCVDFSIVGNAELGADAPEARSGSVYVPSGDVLFDAPLYTESFIDSAGTIQARVWALAAGLPVSVCGQLSGQADRPSLTSPDQELPVVATWRAPKDYVALVARKARVAQGAAWALTILGALALIASVARV